METFHVTYHLAGGEKIALGSVKADTAEEAARQAMDLIAITQGGNRVASIGRSAVVSVTVEQQKQGSAVE